MNIRSLASTILIVIFCRGAGAQIVPSSTDLWNGNRIRATSGFLTNGLGAGDALFGSMVGVEPGNTLFRDHRPQGTVHYVEFDADRLVNTIQVFLSHDTPEPNRAVSNVRLLARDFNQPEWNELFSFNPSIPYQNTSSAPKFAVVTDNAYLALRTTFKPVKAVMYRAEFVQSAMPSSASGPRVSEIDAYFRDPWKILKYKNSWRVQTENENILASFAPRIPDGTPDGTPITLAELATLFEVDHFNWRQTVETPANWNREYWNETTGEETGDRFPNAFVDPVTQLPPIRKTFTKANKAGTRYAFAIPGLDEPFKGQEVIDGLDYYFNESTSPTSALRTHTDDYALYFQDAPRMTTEFYDPGDKLTFRTELVGVGGKFPEGRRLGVGFTWESDARAPAGAPLKISDGEVTFGAFFQVLDATGLPSVDAGGILPEWDFFGLSDDAGLPGDFNHDGEVNTHDLGSWQESFGLYTGGDADNDGSTDGNDFLVWQRNVTTPASPPANQVPEPQTSMLFAMALPLLQAKRRPAAGCIVRDGGAG